MSKLGSTLLLTCCTFFAAAPLRAQAIPVHPQRDQLKLVVILSRHGVRSPTWSLDRLDTYSAKPWPAWPNAPGELTPHGYKLLEALGEYDRDSLISKGLLRADPCAESAATYIWADTDQRTLASGHALAAGLFPACGTQVHTLAAGKNDPLFHPGFSDLPPAVTVAAMDELKQRFFAQPASTDGAVLQALQNLLDDCAPSTRCLSSQPAHGTLFGSPTAIVAGKGDHFVDVQGPLPLASTLSEDLLLEYAEGMPASDVGWGHVDERELRRLIALHTRYFDLMHRTPALARLGSTAMLQQIADTLQQAIEGKPMAGVLAPPQSKLVIFVGHDTNLAGVAALLGVHWSLDGRIDDTSPGTELAFELWQSPSGRSFVRVMLYQQTLQQMRSLQHLTLATPPAQTSLQVRGCSGRVCSWAAFQALVRSFTAASMLRDRKIERAHSSRCRVPDDKAQQRGLRIR